MNKFATLLAFMILLSGCSSNTPAPSSSAPVSSTAQASSIPESSSEVASSMVEEVASSAVQSSAAANESLAASETISSETATPAVSAPQTISAAEQAAAEKAAAEQAAAEKAAAEQAAAEKAAAEQAAAEKAAAEQAAAEKAAAEKETASQKKTPKSGVKAVSGTNFLKRVEEDIIDLINEERVANGLNELEYHVDLRSAARIRSRELYDHDMFAHHRPNGDSWETVLQEDVPLVFKIAGENLCTTTYNDLSANYARDPEFWFTEWVNSKPHYENILRPQYTHIGVGVYCIEKDGFIYAYATTIFAGF